MTTATKTRKIAEQPATETTTAQPVAQVVAPVETSTEEIAPVKRDRKVAEPKLCLCGCGEMTKGGRFRVGHDARLHGALLKASRAGDAAAAAKLVEFGWNDHKDAAERQAEQEANRAERTAQRIAKLDSQIAALQAKRAELIGQTEQPS